MRAGLGRADITVYDPELSLLGWGRFDQRPRGVGEPLMARALCIEDGGRRLAFVCVDLCFVSAALRAGVAKRLNALGVIRGDADLVITATHTHSGPSGFDRAFFYELAGPGFRPAVLRGLVEGVSAAAAQAYGRLEPARMVVGEGAVPRSAPIAFNRSVVAYRDNPEAGGQETAEEAVDRALVVLRVDAAAGRPLGLVSWFALHGTCLHGDLDLVHPDHKGLSASTMEAMARADGAGEEFVAIFAQSAAGDVTPNHRWDRDRGVTIGVHADDTLSARFVARVQASATAACWRSLSGSPGLGEVRELAATLRWASLGSREVGDRGERTTPGRLGVGMAAGTSEGPGPLGFAPPALQRWVARRGELGGAADPKRTLLEVDADRRRRLLGRADPAGLTMPHPALRYAREVAAAGRDLSAEAWIDATLPFALVRLGPLVIVGLPNEPTTVAGYRIRRRMRMHLARAGVRRVVVQGYTNAYSGYVATKEEYRHQRYEGAYTLFGPHTLDAVMEIEAALTDELG